MPGNTVSGRPGSSARGRRTSSRSNAEEQQPCTSSAPAEEIPMETDDVEEVTSGTAELERLDEEEMKSHFIACTYMYFQRSKADVVIFGKSVREILSDPQYAHMGAIEEISAMPEKEKPMEPIEVKIEESEAQGAAPTTSVLPSVGGGEMNVEKAARREAEVISRIAELRKNGLWSNSRLPKCVEPERNKTHWDYLLEEVKWMATDFRAETINKKRLAKAFAGAIAKQHREKEIEVERAAEREVKDKKRLCYGIAKMIKDFWIGVDKVVDIRAKEILESRVRKARNKHLMFMIGQVDEMSNIVQERLVPSKTPSIASHDDDKEFQLGEESESDDEQTIANAEKSQRKDDVRIEVNALQDEANVEMDDFLTTLPPEYLKAYGLTQEDLADMKAENKREREEAERRKREPKVVEMEVDQPSTSNSADPEEEQTQEKDATEGNGDGRGVLVNIDYVKLNSNDSDERQQELANIAEEALKFQPKGHTLETTKINTAVPFLIRGTLREYQMVGLDWMVTLYEKNLNGILADEMGLGKTIQTISLLSHLACTQSIWGPHLIVVPTSVILNWEMEFKKWCPAFKILTYFGTAKERAEKRKGWMKPNCFHVCITSYKTVTQDIRAFKQRAWQYLILDEAQNIKNWKSQRWQALLNVRARRRLLLTGTPLQNSLMELWSLMHFLMPTIFSSHDDFKDWFSNPLTGMMEGNLEFNAPLIQRLHKVLRPFILRRLKKEVEKQLPEKTEHVVQCSLSKRQRYLYDDFMSRRSTKENLKSGNMMSVLNIVMQLRKCCNHPNLFEPRPVLAPFVVPKLQMVFPAYLFNISEQDPDIEPIPECLNLRSLFGWQSQVSSKKPMIEEIEAMEEVLDLSPPEVDGFRFNRTTYTLKSSRDEIGSEEEGRVNGTNGISQSTSGVRASTPNSVSRSAAIRTRTVMNTAPLSISTDRSGFHYTMANNGRGVLDECAPHSPPLKRAKMTGDPVHWTDYVPAQVLEKMEEAKRNQLEIARRRFGLLRRPAVSYELAALLYEEVCGAFPLLRTENESKIQEGMMDYAGLLAERFGMFIEPVLTDAWQCRPSSSGLPAYIRSNQLKVENVSRSLLLKSSTDLETKMRVSRSLQFPELRLIEYDCGKLQTLANLLRDLYQGKHRCLIFTQMSKMLDVLQTFLSHHGYQYFRLDGTTGVEQRQAMMERFNADSKIFCFILSTRSGGVGINLTGADTVIFYDSDWNPTMDAQAQDRCHRIGQTRNVSIYRLISERTIEENILKKAMQKRRLGELAIDEAGFTPEFFKQSDNIRDLFEGEDVDVTAPSDVPINDKELETALAKCEDEADVNAAKIATAEAREDIAEFDETARAPTSNLAVGEDDDVDEKYMELIQQLKPIERFAINLLEAEYKPEFEEECKEAEAMIHQKREEWDKNLNEHPTDDLLNDPFSADFIQSGNLLDEVRDRRKNKAKAKASSSAASGSASSKPKKPPAIIRARSPSKRKSQAPSFNPYISFATHTHASPPDSPIKKTRRSVPSSSNSGGGAAFGGGSSDRAMRATRKRKALAVMVDSDNEEEPVDNDNDYEVPEDHVEDDFAPAPMRQSLIPVQAKKKVTIVTPKEMQKKKPTIVRVVPTSSHLTVSPRPITPTISPANSATSLPSQGPLISPVHRAFASPSSSSSQISSSSGPGPSTSNQATRPIRIAQVFTRPPQQQPSLLPVRMTKLNLGGNVQVVRRTVTGIGAGGVGMSTTGQASRIPTMRYTSATGGPSTSSGGPSSSTTGTRQYVFPQKIRMGAPAQTPLSPNKVMFPVRVVQRPVQHHQQQVANGGSADRPNFGIYERPRLSLRSRFDPSSPGTSRAPTASIQSSAGSSSSNQTASSSSVPAQPPLPSAPHPPQ